MKHHWIWLAALAACSDAELEELEALQALPADQAPVMLDAAPAWDSLTTYANDPAHREAALYGRASAYMTNGRSRCTGWLADDDILMSAEHCFAGDQVTVNFGWFGPTRAEGEAYGRRRLKELGIPRTTAATVPRSDFSEFSCDFEEAGYQDRDVGYWRCDPNVITWSENGRTMRYELLPGTVWGHYNVARGRRSEGVAASVISVNDQCGGGRNLEVLYSEGEITDSDDSCWGDGSHCFEIDADWVGGSSGAPIFQESTLEVFGVVSHSYAWAFWGDYDDPCESFATGYNFGAYIGSPVDTYLDRTKPGYGIGDWAANTAHVGGGGGHARTLTCPEDTLAAGVVGSKSRRDGVGNFGLVCMSHRVPTHTQHLDRATVVVAGSVDTDFVSGAWDFNTYMHEVLSTEMPEYGEQALTMCPAGYFIERIAVKQDRFVERISGIRCENPQNGHEVWRFVNSQNDSGRLIGSLNTGTWGYATCEEDAYFAGLRVNSGYWLDGFEGLCRFED